MESVLVERSPWNLRKVAATDDALILRSLSLGLTSPSSVSVSNLLLPVDRDVGVIFGSYTRAHSSLRCVPPVVRQSHVIASPSSPSFASDSSPTKGSGKHLQKQEKSGPCAALMKDIPKAKSIAIIPQQAESKEDMDFMESVYSKSPPPSSLPLPRFCLAKRKAEGKDVADDGGGVDVNATDSLRRLLNL